MAGLYFEDFEFTQLFRHPLRRTVTEMDNVLFSSLTLNPQPLHIDRHFCETETEWGQPLMNSIFTLGLMIGISVHDTTVGTTIANLGMTDVRFPHPCSRAIRCTSPPRSWENANRSRAPMPALSSSSTNASTSTTRWSPSVAARRF